MKFKVRGYAPIEIPAFALRPMDASFGSGTPYVAKIASRWKSKAYIQNKLPSKLLCLEAVRDRAQVLGGYKSYTDLLAGIGISARIFGAKQLLNDFDPSCRQVLELNFPEAVVSGDDIMKAAITPTDLLFIDFNDFTMKRCIQDVYGGIVKRAARSARKFLVLNDCSLFYFRYGASSFAVYSELMGCKISTVDEYFAAAAEYYLRTFGLHLVHAAYFNEAAFLLLAKKKAARICEQVVVAPGMVTVEEDGTLFS